jgi:hypothetical protein
MLTLLESELLGLVVGAIITVALGSYLIGDNIIYRWVLAILVGAGVGYALGIVLNYLWWDWFFKGMREAQTIVARIRYVVPMLLGALLLLKAFPRISHWGNVSMGAMLGVGAGVAVSGALLGTIIPQIEVAGTAILSQDSVFVGILSIAGTICALLVFASFPLRMASNAPHSKWQQVFRVMITGIQNVGRFFIIIGLGMAFSGAITSALTLLVDRLWDFVKLIELIIG